MENKGLILCSKTDLECLRIKCTDLLAEVDSLLSNSKGVVYTGSISRDQLDAMLYSLFNRQHEVCAEEEGRLRDFLKKKFNIPYQGFAAVARDLLNGSADKYQLGDRIVTTHKSIGTITWTVIGVNCEDLAAMSGRPHITVQAEYIQIYRPFSLPDVGFPEGNSCWNYSSIKQWLQHEFLEGFAETDRKAIAPVQKRICVAPGCCHLELDDVFLLSASEIGAHKEDGSFYHDEGEMYPYYKRVLPSKRATIFRRTGLPSECTANVYWLRSASVDDAKDHAGVLCVNDNGGITVMEPCKGAGVIPVCVIAAADIK